MLIIGKRFDAMKWLCLTAVFVVGFMLLGVANIARAATVYYIDCNGGNDSNPGTATSSAWKTPAAASKVTFGPGDQILLLRGCVWNGSLIINGSGQSGSPIAVNAYGGGNIPRIDSNVSKVHPFRLLGSFITVQNVAANGIAPKTDGGCNGNPVGEIYGFYVAGAYNIIQSVQANNLSAGVMLERGSHDNKVIGSTLGNNKMMVTLTNGGGDDYGAFGVLIIGNNNEIAYNTIFGSLACSYDFGNDGSVVEIYGGSNNRIHHNRTSNSDTFTELAIDPSGGSASNNVYFYNQYVGTQTNGHFLVTRGGGSGRGPVSGTKFWNNTVYLIGSNAYAVYCDGGCSGSILTMNNNVIWAAKNYSDSPFAEGYNVYWASGSTTPVNKYGAGKESATSKVANPMFSNVVNGDFRLLTGSPAIDKGTNFGSNADLNGVAVPVNNVTDIGGYESNAASTVPTATATVAPAPTTVPTDTSGGTTGGKGGKGGKGNGGTSTQSDTTPPAVSFTSPSQSATFGVSVRMNLTATASDNVRVKFVEFAINGAVFCTDKGAPYTCRWRVPNQAGNYTLTATAIDDAGNRATATITITAK
jgi:hypothetical protein